MSGPEEAINDPVAILRILERNEVEYVVIGGFAAEVHGSPYPTYDVDITPKIQSGNLERLASALNGINPRLHAGPHEPGGVPVKLDAKMLSRAEIWNLVTDLGVIDIVTTPAGSKGFSDLVARAERAQIDDDLTVLVASLEDVIRSKAEADREKDRRVLPELRALSEMRRKRGL